MRKFINIALVMLVAISTVGCYESFEDPSAAHVYTDADFADAQLISIYTLKQMYSSLPMDGSSEVTENYVIRGKVISSDEQGNVYKSLYILDHSDPDGSAAIELRLYASNYVEFPVGTMVYVRLQGLVMGDYRGMLSVGATSADPDYANSNIEEKLLRTAHIFRGSTVPMDYRDTVVITRENYTTELTDAMLGRLVRFEGVESTFGTAQWGYNNYFPNYFASSDDSFDWNSTLGEVNEEFIYPPLSFYGQNPTVVHTNSTQTRFYGSSWYSYDREGTDNTSGQYVIRCSAYAYFRTQDIPSDGQFVDLTAIYTVFKSSGNSDTLKAYQLVVNTGSDIVEVNQ
ncbi:MAG: DUF5689 domain-containing protein [Rikenellaceae bacterium]